ncbi:MAG: NAD(P)H-dependent glycerol-3-phosphate dehydrogenase [Anaerovoracaceae bacterium]|jgi:glycerol-3-phosphate dehydrogenase (NAD(P)+)
MKTIGIIGAGSWGTALGILLSTKGHKVRICDVDEDLIRDMKVTRSNEKYLPGLEFNDNVTIVDSNEEALDGADIALFAVPAQHYRSALEKAIPFLDDDIVMVNVAKGIERHTLLRLSEITHILRPGSNYVVLSGPSHAEEVGRLLPATVSVASKDPAYAELIQEEFSTDRFRIYTNDDMIGLELGGSLKNIIALGAGISDGIGFGDSAKAALMTRGITEMTRLGIKLGAKRETFAGLSGVGDLIVTCTSMHSRNRRCGIMIGEGVPPQEAIRRVGMVVEGITTAEAAYELSRREHVEMPITECIYRCVKGEITPEEAVTSLMSRERKNEMVI